MNGHTVHAPGSPISWPIYPPGQYGLFLRSRSHMHARQRRASLPWRSDGAYILDGYDVLTGIILHLPPTPSFWQPSHINIMCIHVPVLQLSLQSRLYMVSPAGKISAFNHYHSLPDGDAGYVPRTSPPASHHPVPHTGWTRQLAPHLSSASFGLALVIKKIGEDGSQVGGTAGRARALSCRRSSNATAAVDRCDACNLLGIE